MYLYLSHGYHSGNSIRQMNRDGESFLCCLVPYPSSLLLVKTASMQDGALDCVFSQRSYAFCCISFLGLGLKRNTNVG